MQNEISTGAVALKQSLVLSFGLSYRQTANITGVAHRTAWHHVAAKPGSNVLAWQYRPKSQQVAANVSAWFAIVGRIWSIQTIDTRGWHKNAVRDLENERTRLLPIVTRYAAQIRAAVGDEAMDVRIAAIVNAPIFGRNDAVSAHELMEFALLVRGTES